MLPRFSWVFALIALFSLSALADKNDVALQQFRDAGAATYIDASYAYAIFPSIGKGGFIVGGAQGNGSVFREGSPIGTASMSQISVGLQFGGQTYSQIIFFEDARALREFTSGEFKFGAQAAAVALNSGATVEASTGSGARVSVNAGDEEGAEIDSQGFVNGIAVFTLTQGGLMLEASLGGQRFRYKPL